MAEHVHALPSGYRLQEYEIVRLLGSGGFGITYLAFDHNLDQARAIKEYLPVDLATRVEGSTVQCSSSGAQKDFEAGLDSFLLEAKMLARFEHKNIVKVHRTFSENGTAYIVMEYAEGEPLDAILKEKRTLDEQALLSILLPVIEGLKIMHDNQVLHRDIKPGNIILRDIDSSPALLDFGAARQTVESKSRSITAIVTGGFAPFEQYSAHGNQGPWTDIYALGALAYTALTGEKPPESPLRMRKDPMVPAITQCAGKAAPAFLKAIDWALHPYEEERPQDLDQWRAAFTDENAIAAHQEQTGTAGPGAPGKMPPQQPDATAPPALNQKRGKRNKAATIAAALAAISLTGAGGAYYYQEQMVPATPVPQLVILPPSDFTMGSDDHDADERPSHAVSIREPIAMSQYEVSVLNYNAFARANGKSLVEGGGNLPVTGVSWQDARDYAAWLSTETGEPYRLPSEAEWEYAAKGENELYNMHGNVWEWVEDCARDNYVGAPDDGSVWTHEPEDAGCSRILRGGSLGSDNDVTRSSYRNWEPPATRRDDIGFRVVKEL